VRYLNFFGSDSRLLADSTPEASYYVDSYAFLDYSAKFWDPHFREARIGDNDNDVAIARLALGIPNPGSKVYLVWSQIYWEAKYQHNLVFPTGLIVVSYFGHSAVVRLLLDKGADIESKDSQYSQTPLSWAARNGHEAVVKLLLDKGTNLEPKDNQFGRMPLSWAAENGHEAVVKLLLVMVWT